MKRFLIKYIGKLWRAIVRVEHVVYCITGCKVELPLHWLYYKTAENQWRKHYYENL